MNQHTKNFDADVDVLPAITRLTRDMKAASIKLSDDEARFLVDAYYIMQENRKRSAAQLRTLGEAGEPHMVLDWLFAQDKLLEAQIKGALGAYAESRPEGRWAQSICGIGPVISAGLIAHIDISKIIYAGQLWRFAGLAPGQKKEKGKKRDWNASLKTLCFHIGECLIKVQNRPTGRFYGKIYSDYKNRITAKNEAGGYSEHAARQLAEKNYGKETVARKHYEAGKLPDGHLHAMARRYIAKYFISHYHQVLHGLYRDDEYQRPWIIEHDEKHKHFIPAPNWPMK